MRLSLFIDYQNVFERARNAFRRGDGSQTRSSVGQINPRLLAELLAGQRTSFRGPLEAEVHDVRVYRGQPPRDHPSYHPWQRQVATWRNDGISVVTRPLRGRGGNLREKGIDVILALDFYAGALAGEFDIGVLFSMDYDLAPAIEMTARECPGVLVETVVWLPGEGGKAYSLVEESLARRHKVWRHQLNARDYKEVEDTTNYTLRTRKR